MEVVIGNEQLESQPPSSFFSWPLLRSIPILSLPSLPLNFPHLPTLAQFRVDTGARAAVVDAKRRYLSFSSPSERLNVRARSDNGPLHVSLNMISQPCQHGIMLFAWIDRTTIICSEPNDLTFASQAHTHFLSLSLFAWVYVCIHCLPSQSILVVAACGLNDNRYPQTCTVLP